MRLYRVHIRNKATQTHLGNATIEARERGVVSLYICGPVVSFYLTTTSIMAEGFGENVAPTAAIRAILGSYPFSIGLLREILQNTDDARATKQVCCCISSVSVS